MRQYWLAHPEKWVRTPDQREKVNARRRELYAADETRRLAAQTQVRQWQRDHPDMRKAQHLKKHGLSLEAYLDLLELQDGKCPICNYSDTSDPYYFPLVDHSHVTGQVRGLLCINCNQALGKFRTSG